MELPVAGDGDGAPGGAVEPFTSEVVRDGLGAGEEAETPLAVEAEGEFGGLAVAGGGLGGVLVGAPGDVHGFAVDLRDVLVLPVVPALDFRAELHFMAFPRGFMDVMTIL